MDECGIYGQDYILGMVWENISQPGTEQRSGVYTRSDVGEHISTRNGTEERCVY